MFYFVIVLLVSDIITHFTKSKPNLSSVFTVSLFITTIIIPSIGNFWLLYVKSITRTNFKKKPIIILTSILFLTNIGFSITSILPGANFYYLISSGTVTPGAFFYVFGIITSLPFALSFIVIISKWNVLKKKRQPFVFVSIGLLPVLGMLGQALNPDYSISLPSIVVTFLIIVLDLQNQLVVTDYLTGLYNRRRLAQKLNEKIMYMKENTLIGGYMIDINNFKLINDEYGHNYGDKTIQDVASILLRLSRPDDLVSRFGGDEFVIIRNLKSISELREFKHLVIDGIDEFNKKSGKLITVQIGIGAQIYTKKDDYTAERFLQIIDDLMYKNKKMIKQLSEQQKDPI